MVGADELIDSMDASGVDAAVTFGFAWADQGLCREANDYVLESVSRWPDRLFGFAQVNPVAKGAMAELERCMHKGLCGLGELMPDGQGYALDDRCLDDIMQQMVHWKRPVLIHGSEPVGHDYPGKSRSTLQPIYQLALRHPEVTFVAAHWGGGLFLYELMPEVQEALRNVYYDTAASLCLYRDDIFALAASHFAEGALCHGLPSDRPRAVSPPHPKGGALDGCPSVHPGWQCGLATADAGYCVTRLSCLRPCPRQDLRPCLSARTGETGG
jgi:predicted TIM-barrel fold metal-dependent hydrolase